MKLRMDKNIVQFFGMSLVMILSGALMVVFFQAKQVQMFGAGIIFGGIMLALVGLYNSTKPNDYFIHDERSIRIQEKAGYHAFWIILLMISYIQLIDIFWKLNIQFKGVASILFVVGMCSWAMLRWFYNKRCKI